MTTTAKKQNRQRKAHDPAATRAALLGAAMGLFARRGFHGATTEQIARRAGVNKAMINYHFGGKRKLLAAVLLTPMCELLDGLRGLLEGPDAADELLKEFVARFAQCAERNAGFVAILLREIISGGELIGRDVVAKMEGVLGVVRAIVARGAKDGSLHPAEPLFVHLNLIGTLAVFFATAPARARVLAKMEQPVAAPDAKEFVAYVQDVMARGLSTVRQDRPLRRNRR